MINYIILVHKNPLQLIRLVNKLSESNVYFYITCNQLFEIDYQKLFQINYINQT